MSSEDQVRPYHARDEDEARGQEAADAVAAVMKHAAERDKASQAKSKPKKQPRWMLPLGINLAVLAVYLLIAPPKWVVVNPIEAPDPARQVQDLRLAMYLQIQRVEGYRLQHGELPEELSEVGSTVPGVEYRRQGSSQYQLVGTAGDQALVYDSTEPAEDFVGNLTERLRGGG
jgi:hypothetical protein